MIRRVLAFAVVALAVLVPPAGAKGGRVVLVTLPGVTWDLVLRARTPALDAVAARGAVAAVSVRSAVRGSTPARGYATLGAGNRALTTRRTIPVRDDGAAQMALRSDAPFENGAALDAVARRAGTRRMGAVVHPAVPAIDSLQRPVGFGTRIGALGEALHRAGVPVGVVSAADVAVDPGRASMRRASVLAASDGSGVVEHGVLDGLVRANPAAPFGVSTDADTFIGSVSSVLDRGARFVVVEPGETLRADEYAPTATPAQADALRLAALERADVLVGRVAALLAPGDTLLVVGVSSPIAEAADRLTPMWASGRRGWLTSPTTRREGLVTLADVAPTVLARLGVPAGQPMSGTAIRAVPADPGDRVERLASLDRESLFRERYVAVATTILIALLVAAGALAFVVFLAPSRPAEALALCALGVLAVPPTATLLRAVRIDRLGLPVASLSAVAAVALLALAAWRIPGSRRLGGICLLLLSFGLMTADVVAGSPLQLNGVFGYSPIVAGRFYGLGNLGFAVFVSSAILGVTGLLDAAGRHRAGAPVTLALTAMVLLLGLPMFGSDLGGVLAGVPGVLVTLSLARSKRIRPLRIAAFASLAGAAAVAVTLLDYSRPPEFRTHLGRLAALVIDGGVPALARVVARKAEANLGLLGATAWTWTIPMTVGVLVLLWRRGGVLRETLPKHPLIRAGLTGTIAAGVLGFAVNDSGIAIPGMVLAHVVPVAILLGLEATEP